jgi:hypothetical protein
MEPKTNSWLQRKMGKSKAKRVLLNTVLSLCIIAMVTVFLAGCALQGVVQQVLNPLGLGGIQTITIPATELGYNRGELVIRLNWRFFKCGGDDTYSNWWIQIENTWVRLFDCSPDPVGFGNEFEAWCDDFDLYTRFTWRENTLQLEDWYANCSGFGFDISGIPDEIEQWFFGYAEDMFMEEIRDEIMSQINPILQNQQICALPCYQAEYFPFTRQGGYTDMTHGEHGCPNTGWAANLSTSQVGSSGERYANIVTNMYGADLGKKYPGLKVTLKAMVKKRAGADSNQTFGKLTVRPTWFMPPTIAEIEFKPSMFPNDYQWYYFTVNYNGGLINQKVWSDVLIDFKDENGAYTGIEWIKVDYVRFHLFNWD